MMHTRRFFSALVAQPGGHQRLGCCALSDRSEEDDGCTTPLLSGPKTSCTLGSSHRHNHDGKGDVNNYQSTDHNSAVPIKSEHREKPSAGDDAVGDSRTMLTGASLLQTRANRLQAAASQTSPAVSSVAIQTSSRQQINQQPQVAETVSNTTTQVSNAITADCSATTQECSTTPESSTITPECSTTTPECNSTTPECNTITPECNTTTPVSDATSVSTVHLLTLPSLSRVVDDNGPVDIKTLISLFSEQIGAPPTPSTTWSTPGRRRSKTRTALPVRYGYKTRRVSSTPSTNIMSEPFIGVKATIRKMTHHDPNDPRDDDEDGGGDELQCRHHHRDRRCKHRQTDDDDDDNDESSDSQKGNHHDHHHHHHHHHHQQQDQQEQQTEDDEQRQLRQASSETMTDTIKMVTDSVDTLPEETAGDGVDRAHCLRPGEIDHDEPPGIVQQSKPKVVAAPPPCPPTPVHGLAKFRKFFHLNRRPERRISCDTF